MAHNTSGPNFLAFDFGTSHLRAAVGEATGAPVAIANRSVNYYKPDGAPDAALEFDAIHAWNLAVEAANEAIHSSKVTAASIKAVGVTSQRHGLVLLDAVRERALCRAEQRPEGRLSGRGCRRRGRR